MCIICHIIKNNFSPLGLFFRISKMVLHYFVACFLRIQYFVEFSMLYIPEILNAYRTFQLLYKKSFIFFFLQTTTMLLLLYSIIFQVCQILSTLFSIVSTAILHIQDFIIATLRSLSFLVAQYLIILLYTSHTICMWCQSILLYNMPIESIMFALYYAQLK